MKIICIGRNYRDHALEMNAPIPTEPIFFLKPDTAICTESSFYYPKITQDLHYECELVIKIDKVGKSIQENFAHKYFSKVSLGIDFTARDLQQKCKEKGLPWEIAKAFDHSAYLSTKWLDFSPKAWEDLEFEFFQNGVSKQKGKTKDLIFTIEQILAYVSKYMTLKTGDLIFTGTPAGVGPIQIGDALEGKINGESMFSVEVK